MATFGNIGFAGVTKNERWDAEFVAPDVIELLAALDARGADQLGTLVVSAQRGVAPDYRADGTVPVLRTANVRDLELSDERQEYVTGTFAASSPRATVKQRDIVVTSTGVGTLGRAFCNIQEQQWFADGHITVLRPDDGVSPEYLAAVLQSRVGRTQLDRAHRGSSGQIEIYPDDIQAVRIPRLGASLEAHVAQLWRQAVGMVESAKQRYPDAEQELMARVGWVAAQDCDAERHFVQRASKLASKERADAEHFEPRNERLRAHLSGQGAKTVGAVIHNLSKGTQPLGYAPHGEVVVVKSKDVNGVGIDFRQCQRTSAASYDDVAARLTGGEVVMNATGLGTLGRAAFIPERPEPTVAAVDLLILRFDPKAVAPGYAALFLNSPLGLAQSWMHQCGSSGQLHLYPHQVREILLYLPVDKNGNPDLKWQNVLAGEVGAAVEARRDAQLLMDEARAIIEKEVYGA